MKKIILLAVMLVIAPAFAQTHVKPYIRKDGTYVEGHYRSAPDGNRYNNYSTQGNANPYTGQPGTINPYNEAYKVPAYHAPRYAIPSSTLYGAPKDDADE